MYRLVRLVYLGIIFGKDTVGQRIFLELLTEKNKAIYANVVSEKHFHSSSVSKKTVTFSSMVVRHDRMTTQFPTIKVKLVT